MESSSNAAKRVAPLCSRLQRSRSSAPDIHPVSTPGARPLSSNSSKSLIPRSNSTSKACAKPKKAVDENRNPKSGKVPDGRYNLAGALHRRQISDAATKAAKQKKTRPSAGSPSAWALSPGRSPAMERPEKQRNGTVGGVLRLFRQKEVPSGKEVAVHQLRTLQTRWMQWRFANARAEAARAAGKSMAEKKIFSVWFENYQLRSSVMEKRIRILRLKAEITLQNIVKSQLPLLSQWERIEQKNLEAVTRTAGNLRTATSKVPVVLGAKVDMFSVHETICAVMDVMEGIAATISVFFTQVESMSASLTELVKVVKQEMESLEELIKISATVASLEAEERSLRAHLIQAHTDQAALSLGSCRLTNGTENEF